MKEYNNKKWWIDSGCVRPISVSAENLKSAILKFREIIKDNYYITISDHAINPGKQNKLDMYLQE